MLELIKQRTSNELHLEANELPFSGQEVKEGLRRDESTGRSFMDRLDKMAKFAETEQETGDGLKFDALEVDIESTAEAFAAEDTIEKLLREARELMQQEQFEDALGRLEEILEESPHAEALFLSAVCLYRLGEPMKAAVRLGGFESQNLAGSLRTKVNVLREELRRVLTIKAQIETMMLLLAGEVAEAAKQLCKFVEVDPDCAVYRYLRAGALMLCEEFEEALQDISAGLRAGTDEEREMLEGLRTEVERRLIPRLMEPARYFYRQGKYRQARAGLKRLDPAIRATRACQVFDSYLKKLDGSGLLRIFAPSKNPAGARPAGTEDEVRRLHEFIVEEELAAIRPLVEKEDWSAAVPVLRRALEFTPHFTYLHYLLGGCLLSRTMGQFGDGKTPPPARDVADDLNEALHHTTLGSDGIPAAGELAETIRARITECREVVERDRQVEVVNNAVQEFNDITDSLRNRKASRAQARELRRRLERLQERLVVSGAEVTDPALGKHLNDLTSVVDKTLDEWKAQSSEADAIAGGLEELESIVSQANQGIDTRQDVDNIRGRLRSLKGRLPKIRKKVTTTQGKEAVNKLSEAIESNLRGLEEAGDSVVVDGLVKRFNTIMEPLKSGNVTFTSQDQVIAVKNFLQQILDDCIDARGSVTGHQQRQVLDQLEDAIRNVLGQFPV